jgi:type IV pilus assembly protein PilN
MIRINLLPHRQLRRAKQQREFNLMLAMGGIAALAILIFGRTYIGNAIYEQESRNERLSAAISQYEKELVEISTLKSKIKDVIERKKVVENLQSNRSQAVILLDEISRKLPEGVILRSVKQHAQDITLVGIADTNARVATLVRNINDSEYLAAPNLVEIKSENLNNIRQNIFTITLVQKQTATEEQSKNSANQPKKLLGPHS